MIKLKTLSTGHAQTMLLASVKMALWLTTCLLFILEVSAFHIDTKTEQFILCLFQALLIPSLMV